MGKKEKQFMREAFPCCSTTWGNCFRFSVHFSAIIFQAGPQTHLTRRHSPLFPLKILHTHFICESEEQFQQLNLMWIFMFKIWFFLEVIMYYVPYWDILKFLSFLFFIFFSQCPFGCFVSLLLLCDTWAHSLMTRSRSLKKAFLVSI